MSDKKWDASGADQHKELLPDEQYVIKTKAGRVVLYYNVDTDMIIVQARAMLLIQPRADNSIGIAHTRDGGRN